MKSFKKRRHTNIHKCYKPNIYNIYRDWGRGENGGESKTYVEKRSVSFIYLIVDNKMALLSILLIESCPYR